MNKDKNIKQEEEDPNENKKDNDINHDISGLFDNNENKDVLDNENNENNKNNDLNINQNEKYEKTKIIDELLYGNKAIQDILHFSSSSKKSDNANENNIEEDKKNKNNAKKLPPQCNIFSTEKIDLMFGPEQTSNNKSDKKAENQIVKENDLNIYDNPDGKNKINENFTIEKQDIEKFDVLIEPEKSPQKKDDKYSNIIVRTVIKSINPDPNSEKKVEKIDNENQTLNDELTISKQNKNQFTIYSDPSQKQLLFNNDRTQFDSTNSFSIKIDKKKINKYDLYKGIENITNAIKKNNRDLIQLIKQKNLNDKKEKMKNIIENRENNSLLKKCFDKWKNPYNIRERSLKRVINNFFKKKLRLQKMIKDLPKNQNEKDNKESKKIILKHYLDKWKDNANKLSDLYKNNKKRISVRKNPKKLRNNKSVQKMNKFMKQKKLLSKNFKKWINNTLDSENIVTHNQILQKLKNYLTNKIDSVEITNEKENKNKELINKLKKAILQSLLRLYKEQKNKIIKKILGKWKQNSKPTMKYVKKVVPGSSTYKSQDRNLSNISINYSNIESNSSNVKQFYPKKISKTSKYSSIGKKKPKNDNIISINENINNSRSINNRNNNKLNTDESIKKEIRTYNPNLNYNKNISFGDLRQFPLDQSDNTLPNKILEKIKKRSEQYSNEYFSDIMDNNMEPNHQKRVVSMIQRIQNIYRSPNQSSYSNKNNNLNSNITNRSSKDIFNYKSQKCIFSKKKKKVKSKSKKYKNEKTYNQLEDKKEQLSDESSVNTSTMNGINLQETKVENLKPVIYTSQSFFIDKKTINTNNANNSDKNNNVNANEISTISFYKTLNKKYPMKMKGDFRKLIEKNPEILRQKNPRIQVTNATCELEQFEERNKSGFYKNDNNLLKLNMNLNIKNKLKKKELSEVVYNCDRDIYESQEPYESQKQRWISMSIPLNNDKAKWEFLNGVKGERHKNNANKFELIQKNKYKSNTYKNRNKTKLVEKTRKKSKKKNHSLSKIMEDSVEDNNVEYDLREMNFTQFYRSPMTIARRDGNASFSPATVKLVKKSKSKKKNGTYNSRISYGNYNERNSNYNSNNDESSKE